MILHETGLSSVFSPKRFIVMIVFCIGVAVPSSFAQEDPRNFLGASFGGSDFHIKDEHFSPMIYGSLGIAPSLQYFYRGDASRQYAEVSYYHDYLATTADNFHDMDNRARVRYSYLHSITDFDILDQHIFFFAGGSVNSFLSHSDYYYLYVQQINARSYESWQWSNSVDLSLQLEYSSAAREFLSVEFFVPIVSNVSRPQYSPSGDFNYSVSDWKFKMFGETVAFPNNFSLNTLLVYQRPLWESLNLQLSYEFYYSFFNKPQDIGMYMNNFRAGFFWCF
jgi:hypothetical protein